MLQVIPWHSPVTINTIGPPIEGIVLGISIRANVRYEIGYWSGQDWRETWFDADLIETKVEQRESIGYKTGRHAAEMAGMVASKGQ